MVNIQKLREKAKVLDLSYGNGTGKFVESVSAEMQDNALNSRHALSASSIICSCTIRDVCEALMLYLCWVIVFVGPGVCSVYRKQRYG